MRVWKTHLITLSSIAVLLLLGLFGVEKTVNNIYTEQPHFSVVVGEIVESASVGQTFIAEYNGLSRVELLLTTYGRHNTGPLIFHLRASATDSDLVTIVIESGEVRDNTYQVFEFPPLRGLSGQRLYFFVEAPQATSGNAIGVWGVTEDFYPDGKAIIRGVNDRGIQDLAFRLGYQPSVLEKSDILLGRLAANKPSLWGDRKLYICLGGAYFVLLYTVLLRVAQKC